MKLKEGDPETLTLLDDIARCMLLSCAAIIQQYSKGSAFQHVPNWTSVSNNDPRIKSHPRFDKTMGYSSSAAAEASTCFEPPHAPMSIHLSTNDTFTLLPTVLALLLIWLRSPHRTLNPGQYLPHHIPPAAPVKHSLFVAGMKKKPAKVTPQVGNSKKRKVAEEDANEAVMTDAPELPSRSSKPRQKRKKKFLSDKDQDQAPTRTVYVIPKLHTLLYK
ncbi:uncharacterized protein HD556DRAFT_1302872 [Suillus plorans]|uniref:Uncharacterized protein n=1 Tax=Suillus plorans TaxID=116603 RepID=A0A9P7DYB0_9AGAM|nr:uncharacterized protein HD556DRAFT_1302872 [Suillus plorans]KAG1806382.1 hypothetical protein HD556DRAFT_1302872 [Suillus plorans]